jgi:hypothetical protein
LTFTSPLPLSSLGLGREPDFLLAGEGSIEERGRSPLSKSVPLSDQTDVTTCAYKRVGEGDTGGEVEMLKQLKRNGTPISILALAACSLVSFLPEVRTGRKKKCP